MIRLIRHIIQISALIAFSIYIFVSIAFAKDDGPINKALVDAAPKEEPAPMPHLDADNPDVILLREDPARDMWREKRDYSKDPKRTPGPVSLQRYEAQMENVGVKTF